MKKIIFVLVLCVFAFTTNAQESIKITDVYQDYESCLISQFVVNYEGISASDIKKSVEYWASDIFVNVDEVEIVNGEDYLIYNSLLSYSFDGGKLLGNLSYYIKIKTKFDFKDGKMRVTINELDFTSELGYTFKTKDYFVLEDELKNKGVQKINYRKVNGIIKANQYWISTIKGIKLLSSNEDW